MTYACDLLQLANIHAHDLLIGIDVPQHKVEAGRTRGSGLLGTDRWRRAIENPAPGPVGIASGVCGHCIGWM